MIFKLVKICCSTGNDSAGWEYDGFANPAIFPKNSTLFTKWNKTENFTAVPEIFTKNNQNVFSKVAKN